MRKIPTKGRNSLQSLGLTRLKPFAVNFYKYAGKPCYPAQHCICATKSDLHGSVGPTAPHLVTLARALYGQLGAWNFFGACIFAPRSEQHPIQNSPHYKYHTPFLTSYVVRAGRTLIPFAPVAQLDRVSDSDSEGRWFESSRAYFPQSLCFRRVAGVFCFGKSAG